ncbi:MAG: monovalent cation:proton antiporter-2 (CPA2) family protein [Thermodesulforhabdaceae bacterium]
MVIELLKSLVIIFGISAAVVFFLGRLRVPSVIGFIISGLLIGPSGLNLVQDIHAIEIFAEIGVILLMFTLGMEFSISELFSMRKEVFGAGSFQIVLTIFLSALLAVTVFRQSLNEAIFYGFLLALSSTAIILKLLMEKGETGSPHGRYAVGILLFQDISVVPLMLAIPLLGGSNSQVTHILVTVLKAFGILLLVFIAARWLIPVLLNEVVRLRSRELFIIVILFLCISTALFTSYIGLSLALGAFLAGVIISESEYASQAISDILPFKESFIALFFISIGMLIDLSFLMAHVHLVIEIFVLIVAVKSLAIFFVVFVLSRSPVIALRSTLCLFQIGEFSFVLATAGKKFGLISDNGYQIFLVSSIVTMLITPLFVNFSDRLAYGIVGLFVRNKERLSRLAEEVSDGGEESQFSDHVIIVGFGINGINLARTLKVTNIPYCILEMNPRTVYRYKKLGEPISYGDGTSLEILRKLGIKSARMLVIVISDPSAARRIVKIARAENKDLHILVRTRYVAEVEDLIKLGANEVIPEEFETSIEIFARVLSHYNFPRNVILRHIEDIRQNSYEMLRNPGQNLLPLAHRKDFLKAISTELYRVTESSKAIGKSLRELDLRKKTGITVIAIQRDDDIIQNPDPELILREGDILLLIGNRDQLCTTMSYLEGEECHLATP